MNADLTHGRTGAALGAACAVELARGRGAYIASCRRLGARTAWADAATTSAMTKVTRTATRHTSKVNIKVSTGSVLQTPRCDDIGYSSCQSGLAWLALHLGSPSSALRLA